MSVGNLNEPCFQAGKKVVPRAVTWCGFIEVFHLVMNIWTSRSGGKALRCGRLKPKRSYDIFSDSWSRSSSERHNAYSGDGVRLLKRLLEPYKGLVGFPKVIAPLTYAVSFVDGNSSELALLMDSL